VLGVVYRRSCRYPSCAVGPPADPRAVGKAECRNESDKDDDESSNEEPSHFEP